MKELIVISGKGGTGKTSLTACFASLAEKCVIADCDVDAADLHLILNPAIRYRDLFKCGFKARINKEKCIECGKCVEICRFSAIDENYRVDDISCEGCGVCEYFCPENAIDLIENVSGEWYVSETRFGMFVHAKLGIAEENSGKLVALVRSVAKINAKKDNCNILIVDGAPGIGCPVISSITGADYVLIVTEPTLSGRHDLIRVAKLTKHFTVRTGVCINKYDLNENISHEIELFCKGNNIDFLGKIPYSEVFVEAMVARKSVIEYSDGELSKNIKSIWNKIRDELEKL
jgi:MinD superfamily P-loop ATPase